MDARTQAWLDEVADDLLDRTADAIVADAEAYAPRDTGRLATSIERTPVSGKSVEIGSNAEYSVYVELGTEDMAPQPFLRPALLKRRGA